MYISEEQLSRILLAIETNASKSNCTSTILSALSVFIAFVAVIVSVYTTQQQNKISLYELRYKYYQQFKALSDFSILCNKINFSENPNVAAAIEHCKNLYLDVHFSILDDKEYAHNRRILQESYAVAGLSSDKFLLYSLVNLFNLSSDLAEDTYSPLEEFIKILFNIGNQNQATNTMCSTLESKKTTFITSFSKLENKINFKYFLKIAYNFSDNKGGKT